MLTEWTPPSNYDEAQERRLTLIAEVEEIDAQLRDKRKRNTMGDEAWEEWRTKAIWAKVHRVQDLRLTKQWILNEQE